MKIKITNNYHKWFVICVLFVIFGLNFDNSDFLNYQNMYIVIGNGMWFPNIEYGFQFAIRLGNLFHLDYFEFVFIYSLIGIIIFVKGLEYLTDNISSTLWCYFVFPFFLDVIQIRNFIAMVIFTYAIHFLFVTNKANIFKYIILIILAGSFHSVAFIYFIFLLCFLDKKLIDYLMLYLIGAGILLILFSDYIFTFVGEYFPRFFVHVQDGTKGLTKFFLIIYIAYIVFIFFYIRNKYKERENKFETIFSICKISVIFFFVMIYSVDMFRLYRNLLPTFYGVWCNYLYINKKIKVDILLFLSILLLVSFYAFIGIYTFQDVIINTLKNNYMYYWIRDFIISL